MDTLVQAHLQSSAQITVDTYTDYLQIVFAQVNLLIFFELDFHRELFD